MISADRTTGVLDTFRRGVRNELEIPWRAAIRDFKKRKTSVQVDRHMIP